MKCFLFFPNSVLISPDSVFFRLNFSGGGCVLSLLPVRLPLSDHVFCVSQCLRFWRSSGSPHAALLTATQRATSSSTTLTSAGTASYRSVTWQWSHDYIVSCVFVKHVMWFPAGGAQQQEGGGSRRELGLGEAAPDSALPVHTGVWRCTCDFTAVGVCVIVLSCVFRWSTVRKAL